MFGTNAGPDISSLFLKGWSLPDALIAQPDPLDSLLERYRRPAKAKEQLVYEFTQDAALLHQYELLLKREHRAASTLSEEAQKNSYILIARQGKLCVGGARLTVRRAGEGWALPMEAGGRFALKQALSSWELDHFTHAEISDFVMLEDYNTKEMLYSLSENLNYQAKALDVAYGFCCASRSFALKVQKINNRIGLYRAGVRWSLRMPVSSAHADVKMYLCTFKTLRFSDVAFVQQGGFSALELEGAL